MRKSALAAIAALLLPLAAHAQTAEDLANSAKNTDNVLNYGMGYDLRRFTALTQIDTHNVRHLAPVSACGAAG